MRKHKNLLYAFLYLLYMSLLTLFMCNDKLNDLLGGLLYNKESIGNQLELIAVICTFVTFLIYNFKLPYEQKATRTGIRAMVITVAILAIVATAVDLKFNIIKNYILEIENEIVYQDTLWHMIILLIVGCIVFGLDLHRYYKENRKRDKILYGAITWAANAPLISGILFTILLTHYRLGSVTPQEASIFLGGALAFQLSFYLGSYLLILAFLRTFLEKRSSGEQIK